MTTNRLGRAGAGTIAIVVAFAVGPLLLVALLDRPGSGVPMALRADAAASLAAPTRRTVTDERQLRIVATAIPGPEITASAARDTVTMVSAKPGEPLADGGPWENRIAPG